MADKRNSRSSAGKQRRGRAPFAVRTLASLDQRSHGARFAFTLMARLLRDVAGDIDRATTAQRELAKHAGLLGLSLEDAACRMLEGEEIDMTAFMALVNCQRRCLESLGINARAMQDVTPRLRDYIRSHDEAAAEPKPETVDA